MNKDFKSPKHFELDVSARQPNKGRGRAKSKVMFRHGQIRNNKSFDGAPIPFDGMDTSDEYVELEEDGDPQTPIGAL
jgi:hypothetical protein